VTEPRRLRAALHLLDHQILDCDGRHAGKVDDLEFEVVTPGDPPQMTAILSGAGALAAQIGGRLGHAIERTEARLADSPVPSRIPFAYVREIASHVRTRVPRSALPTNRAERWVRTQVIEHIPGARHAPE
jgi:hypothetical protein